MIHESEGVPAEWLRFGYFLRGWLNDLQTRPGYGSLSLSQTRGLVSGDDLVDMDFDWEPAENALILDLKFAREPHRFTWRRLLEARDWGKIADYDATTSRFERRFVGSPDASRATIAALDMLRNVGEVEDPSWLTMHDGMANLIFGEGTRVEEPSDGDAW